MSSAGFSLHPWSSNSEGFGTQAKSDNIEDTDKCTKVLGMRWDMECDLLQFQNRQIPVFDITIKREILQQTSSIFYVR